TGCSPWTSATCRTRHTPWSRKCGSSSICWKVWCDPDKSVGGVNEKPRWVVCGDCPAGFILLWSGREPNPRPLQCDCVALPTELPAQGVLILPPPSRADKETAQRDDFIFSR